MNYLMKYVYTKCVIVDLLYIPDLILKLYVFKPLLYEIFL